jgi:hypothetical protein
MSVIHRIRLPIGAVPMVEVGRRVEPTDILATRRVPRGGTSLPVALPLRRSAAAAAACVVPRAGQMLEAGAVLAADGQGREVRVREACLFLGYDPDDGTSLVAALGGEEPIRGHVRGVVVDLNAEAVEVRVPGALVAGVGGSGDAVHGELRVAVHEPIDELRAGAIDVGAGGRILVGGSRASAETLTRARAMGVAGIVLGGVLDKELRDFEASQQRRRETGATAATFGVLLLEGYGKVGFDPGLFAWFRAHDGHMASLFGGGGRMYVYDAEPPPVRRGLPRPGDRVIAHRRPFAGIDGEVVRVLDRLNAAPSGVVARAALVRFEDGRSAVVPLANMEATDRLSGA